jgi:hypothetical protein
LLEAAPGHAENRVHAFDDLAEGARIEAHEELAGFRDGVGREVDLVFYGRFELAVEDDVLFAAVGNDLNFTNHDVGVVWSARDVRGESEVEFPYAFCFQSEMSSADAAGINLDRFVACVLNE